jgi:hypothetical protein
MAHLIRFQRTANAPTRRDCGTVAGRGWARRADLRESASRPRQSKLGGHNNSLKSVVGRVVRADVHPFIAVPNYAGVRVVSRIVVGISRRETQTCACYERHKAPTSKAGHTKTPADGGGANPWGYRGRAEPGTNRACAEPRANRGRAEPNTSEATADGSTPEATTDGSTSEATADASTSEATADASTSEATADGRAPKATTDGRAPEATADGSTAEATTDGRAPEAAADGSTAEATAAKSTPAEATTLSKSPIREHRCQYQGRSSSKPKSFHGGLLHTTVTSLKNI